MELINKETLRTREGPLGDLADEYPVSVVTGSYEKVKDENTGKKSVPTRKQRSSKTKVPEDH